MASLALRDLVAGPVRPATVLGSSTHAVWFGLGRDVVVLTSREATRLPNSVEVPAPAGGDSFDSPSYAGPARVGGGSIDVGHRTVRVARWWDPRPTLRATEAPALRRRIRGLMALAPSVDSAELEGAVCTVDPAALLGAAGALLGMGGGLTPEGDDLVAGTVAGLHTLGRALGRSDVTATIAAIAPALGAMAHARTTSFSAALLHHAARGEVAAPAAAFLHALAGRGNVIATHRRLAAVGHTSGRALAAGVLLAARSLIQGENP